MTGKLAFYSLGLSGRCNREQGGRWRRGRARGSEGFDLRYSNDSDCHSCCCKSVAESNECKWMCQKTQRRGQGKYWLRNLIQICKAGYKKKKRKTTAGTTEANLQATMETIRKMLKMPGWTQHLLSELTTLKRHV